MIWRNILHSLVALLVIMALTGWSIKEKDDVLAEQIVDLSGQFEQIQADVRERNISPDSAARAFQVVMRHVRQTMNAIDSCPDPTAAKFVYPVRGYLQKHSIGGNGRGYFVRNFDLFNDEVRGSHPAHDLFIKDGDQDNLDDRTRQPVDLTVI